jgi:hypothetical protein
MQSVNGTVSTFNYTTNTTSVFSTWMGNTTTAAGPYTLTINVTTSTPMAALAMDNLRFYPGPTPSPKPTAVLDFDDVPVGTQYTDASGERPH